MNEIILHFALNEGNDPEPTADEIQARLEQLDEVEEAEAVPSTERLGVVETALVITAAVTLVRQSRTLVDELTMLTQSLKRLAVELAGVQDVFVELKGKRVNVHDLTAEEARSLIR